MPDTETTTIALSRTTHRRVKSLKQGGETFDDLIQKMADKYEDERW